jgi:ABC-type transporter MlaC component
LRFKHIRSYIITLCFTFVAVASLYAKAETKDKDKKDPGLKLVVEMLDYFNKVDANRQKYIRGDQTYAQYMKEDKKLSDLISGYIDFYDVCEKSLKYDYDSKKKVFKKDHWEKRSANDKANFVSVFMQLIESIVYPIAGEYFKDISMRHTVVSSKKNDIHLRTYIKNKKKKKRRDQEYIMEWFLHPKKDGSGWIIYDISIEDERWVPGFRSQFSDVITKKSYNELVKMMKDKLKETLDDRKSKDQKDRKEADEKKS